MKVQKNSVMSKDDPRFYHILDQNIGLYQHRSNIKNYKIINNKSSHYSLRMNINPSVFCLLGEWTV